MSQARKPQKKAGLFQMNHALGQNMLKSKVVVKGIVDNGETRPGDLVLEIGPGVGNMTEEILSRGCRVLAVEKDPRMCVELQKRFQNHPNLRIIQGDILTAELPQFDVCISNIPYNISSAIIFKLLERPTFRRAVLMVQKEFAQRIVSRPNDKAWGRLALNTQLFATVKKVMDVNRKNFVPAPKVDSAVITIQPRECQPDLRFSEWDGLVKLCFTRPNRTLGATFAKKKTLKLLEDNQKTFLEMQGVTEPPEPIQILCQRILEETMLSDARPIQLDIEDFVGLLERFNAAGVHFE